MSRNVCIRTRKQEPRIFFIFSSVDSIGLTSSVYPSLPGRVQRTQFKRQLHTTHVGTGGWEPHGSSPTACAGKVDQPKLAIGVPVNLRKKNNKSK